MLGAFLETQPVHAQLPLHRRAVQWIGQAAPGTALPQGGFVVCCGACVQVGPRSDSMDKFCELFGVPKWLRQATRLMTRTHIAIAGDTLVVKQVRGMSPLCVGSNTFLGCLGSVVSAGGACVTHDRVLDRNAVLIRLSMGCLGWQ